MISTATAPSAGDDARGDNDHERHVQDAVRHSVRQLDHARPHPLQGLALRPVADLALVREAGLHRFGHLDRAEAGRPRCIALDPDPALEALQGRAAVGVRQLVLDYEGLALPALDPAFDRERVTEARSIGVFTIGLVCNRDSQIATLSDITIAPIVGPEILSGSTRMKAGTATKMVLNMLSTGAMIRLGKTFGNLMVDVRASNSKLADRARRIVRAITNLSDQESEQLLKSCRGEVKTAI